MLFLLGIFITFVITLVIHFAGVALCLREPRFFDLWLVRIGRCPRVRNHAIWRCNSYRP